MSLGDSTKQERVEEFLRKSLLGEEASCPLCKQCSPCEEFNIFLGLSDINPSDLSLSDLADSNEIPSDVQVEDYGYGSDSDIDDDDRVPPIPIAEPLVAPNDKPTATSSHPHTNITTRPKDEEELSDDSDSESDASDIFVMSPEHPPVDALFSVNRDSAGLVADPVVNHTTVTVRLRSLGSRHVLVKDTAFQTWYILLNYLYTGKFNFLPLTSTVPEGQLPASSASALDEPKCSAKSMYRLACKVGLEELRDQALAHIRNNLTEQNILKELSCSLASKHPKLLEMELDVLYTHIASSPVVTGFPALARRIANKELPHGVDIIVGIHARLLNERQSLPSTPMPPLPPTITSPSCSLPPSPRPRSSPDVSEPPPPDVLDLNSTMEHEREPLSVGGPLSGGFGFGTPVPASPARNASVFGGGLGLWGTTTQPQISCFDTESFSTSKSEDDVLPTSQPETPKPIASGKKVSNLNKKKKK